MTSSPHDKRFPAPPEGLEVIYEDETVVAINKPPWLLSVPGRGPDKQDSAFTRVAQRYGELYVAHRLDCATSGVMLFARTKDAERHLHRQFRERIPEKSYIALCYGLAPHPQGEVDLPLITDWPNRPKQKVDNENGKPSQTHYTVLEQTEETARMLLKPITGRSHQLRVHMAELGLPIIGDRLYAPVSVTAQSERLMLHAETLRVQHPAQDKKLELYCKTPF